MISVTGGKLTTYRKMAADTVDEVVRATGHGRRRSPTKKLPIRGRGEVTALRDAGAAARLGIDPAVLEHLVGRYGDETPRVLALIDEDAGLAEPLVAGLPYLAAEAVWAVREEMARSLSDVLARRTRAQIRARDATAAAAERVAALIAPALGWDAEEATRQVAAFREAVAHEREAANLPVTA